MRKEVALLVNKEIHTFALEALQAYILDRIDQLHLAMETSNKDEYLKLQGAISELRTFLKIKDYASRVLEKEKTNGNSSFNIHRR